MEKVNQRVLAKAELFSLLSQKDQTLVVRIKLKRMYAETMNMTAEMGAEQLPGTIDQHTNNIRLPDG